MERLLYVEKSKKELSSLPKGEKFYGNLVS